MPTELAKNGTLNRTLGRQGFAIPVAETAQQRRRALDVAEQHRDRPSWKLPHAPDYQATPADSGQQYAPGRQQSRAQEQHDLLKRGASRRPRSPGAPTHRCAGEDAIPDSTTFIGTGHRWLNMDGRDPQMTAPAAAPGTALADPLQQAAGDRSAPDQPHLRRS